jgi:hypothetical protein
MAFRLMVCPWGCEKVRSLCRFYFLRRDWQDLLSAQGRNRDRGRIAKREGKGNASKNLPLLWVGHGLADAGESKRLRKVWRVGLQ